MKIGDLVNLIAGGSNGYDEDSIPEDFTFGLVVEISKGGLIRVLWRHEASGSGFWYYRGELSVVTAS